MTITLGQVKQSVLTIVNKTASNKGFYTDDKMELGVQDGLAIISSEMFLAGQGWQARVRTIPVEAGMVSVDVPKDVSFINNLRWLFGGIYYPMTWDTQQSSPQVKPGTGVNVMPPTYRILNDAIWFNPALSNGGEIQIEYTTYMRNPSSDADKLPAQFDLSMLQFLIYHVATFCVKTVGKADPEWADTEAYWYQQMSKIMLKRNNQPTYIKDFQG